MNKLLLTWLCLVVFTALGFSDTFKHKSKDMLYHGYATGQMRDGLNVVMTEKQGQVDINLAEYEVELNSVGRNSFVSLLSIIDVIELELETNAFIEAIAEEVAKGPLFILIEIDTPGGRVDLAKQICAAISETKCCHTIAYIKGGENGGALSAGAAISLACNEIYMTPGTTIGAATMIATGHGQVTDMKGAYGDAVGEKLNSAWRTFLASLAQENNRSGALAKAMADKDIVVVEVERKGKTLYIESKDKLPSDKMVHTICPKGELLTLAADNAAKCNIADGVTDSRQALLVELGHGSVPVKKNTKTSEAKAEYEKVVRKFNKLMERLDLKFKELGAKADRQALTRNQALRDFEVLIKNAQYLQNLKRSYPDIPFSEQGITEFINDLKAEHASLKAMR